MNDFYVYKYLRSKDSEHGLAGSPYYIGKGRKDRAYERCGHSAFPKDRSNIVIIADTLSEVDAFQAEMLLIHLYGRIDNETGCLRNKTDGGEGVAGRLITEEERLALSLRFKGTSFSETHKQRISVSLTGKPKSEAARVNNRIAQKRFASSAGYINSFQGRNHSTETKKVIRAKRAKQVCSEDTRKKMSESHKTFWKSEAGQAAVARQRERPNSFQGKHHSEETRNRLSQLRKGKPTGRKGQRLSEEAKAKLREGWRRRKEKLEMEKTAA